MKKVFVLGVVGTFLLATVSLQANTKLMKLHKEVKGGIAITKCTDCHNDKTKLEKKKGADYKALLKTPDCSAQGCHK